MRRNQQSAPAPAQFVHHGSHHGTRLRVNCNQRLIQQQHLGLLRQGTREQRTLLLAAA